MTKAKLFSALAALVAEASGQPDLPSPLLSLIKKEVLSKRLQEEAALARRHIGLDINTFSLKSEKSLCDVLMHGHV